MEFKAQRLQRKCGFHERICVRVETSPSWNYLQNLSRSSRKERTFDQPRLREFKIIDECVTGDESCEVKEDRAIENTAG